DGEYFFWGHNNGALTTTTSGIPAGIQNRYTRVWRGQETGDITDLDIEFDLTGLGSITTHRLRLLVDTDDDGSFADETPISGAASLGSNRYRFSNVTELTSSTSASHRFTLATASLVGPGGVTGNLVWWLKADAGVFNASSILAADGDAVSLWMDQTSNPNDAANTDALNTHPVFRTNIINGYPALEFEGGTRFMDATGPMGIAGNESLIIFLVFKQNSYQTNGGNDDKGTFIIDRPTATNNLASFKVINTDKYFYQRREDDGSDLGGPISVTPVNTQNFVLIDYYRYLNGGSSEEGIYIDGRLDVTTSGPTGSMTVPNLRIGKHATNSPGGLDGYFVEIVAYDDDLGDQERQKVESYLALKYGITLDPSVDYLRSGGSIIYPSTSGTHSGYVHDIAGIGRDDNSGLYQPTSRSQNVGNMITISNPSNLQNNRFLVWGHNNGDLTAPTNADVGGNIELRLSRVWKVSQTGSSLGTVSVTVDMSWVPGPETASDLRLLVDSDGNFVNATEYSVSSSSGDLYTFDNVTLNTNNYFTIGTVDKYNTTLPVELTSFDVTYEPPVVVATWETASETNNDYFTLERAGEDMNFFELVHQPGAGTSNVPHTYTAIDPNPFGGRSYYRLKQTDYDGKTAYSAIRRMDIDETGRELVLYPNPNEGRDMEFSMGNAVFQLEEVEVINSQGISLERQRINALNVNRYTVHLDRPLRPGFYLVRALCNGKWTAFRVVVGDKQ
ncbi:MAG TPA: T9SS type A sorting domain-containing protein, partial [Cyclobacteriaceae bacterium]